MYSFLNTIANANQIGLNIPYQVWSKMDLESDKSRIGLLVLSGFIERFIEENDERKEGNSTEKYKSEIDPYYYDKKKRKSRK